MSEAQPEVPAGWRLIALDSVDSTNEKAKTLAQVGAEAGTVVWARRQVAGRGRHGRSWQSPPGNLYLSIILRPACAPADAPQLGFVAGVALVEALGELAELPAALKWPNDVVVDGKKASGILLESAANPDGSLAWVVVGVGVNVAVSPPELPDVTSLNEQGAALAVEAVLSAFLARLFHWADMWRVRGFAPVRRRWLSLAPPIGSATRVRLPAGELNGRFSGIDERGSLLLETDDGARRVDVGDVFPAAPVGERVG